MSGFSAEWLALREPADTAARSDGLAKFVARTGRMLDLGGGTGANVRYLSSRLPSPQFWTIVDDDQSLLSRAPVNVTSVRTDLNRALDDGELFEGCAIVTASALLDLVSESWLQKLVARCEAAGAAVLFALSYDGRISCSPEDPEDDEVRTLVNRHQKSDKGFGPALGPDAGARAVALLTAAGYTTRQAQSDWKLTSDMGQLQVELINGWASAAADVAPQKASAIHGWRSRRLAHVTDGRSRIVVGHLDVAGILRA
ncbi:MAG TPA: hypothetical protein VN628_08880 [Vicinamibacterales bacterium]|nr:hypothetical protein [Vicinamibacterales bacterium]